MQGHEPDCLVPCTCLSRSVRAEACLLCDGKGRKQLSGGYPTQHIQIQGYLEQPPKGGGCSLSAFWGYACSRGWLWGLILA